MCNPILIPTPSDNRTSQDVIRAFYRGKRNLVIDSLNPRLFPHIVITPAVEDVFDDFFVAWRNRTEPQWLAFLCVPASDISPASLPPVLWRPSQVEHPGNETRVETSIDANLCDRTSCQNADSDKAEGPKRVFSYSRFTVFVCASSANSSSPYSYFDASRNGQQRNASSCIM